MPQSPVGTDFDQPPNVLVHFPAQIALGYILPVDDFPDAVHLALAQFIHPGGQFRVQARLGQNFRGHQGADPVDAPQGNMRPLAVGYINAGDTNHSQSSSFPARAG